MPVHAKVTPMNSVRSRDVTAVLEESHELVRRTLHLLAGYAGLAASGLPYDPRLAESFAKFFRSFVERLQDEHESGVLFPWLARHGLPEDSGPLAVLRIEHDVARILQRELQDAARALSLSPGDVDNRLSFHERALRLVEHHLAHLDKEDAVILPLARRLAERLGAAPSVACSGSAHERRWLEALEAHRTDDWPEAALTRLGLGSTEAFERLCATSIVLAREEAASRN